MNRELNIDNKNANNITKLDTGTTKRFVSKPIKDNFPKMPIVIGKVAI